MRILVIDDSSLVTGILQSALEDSGYTVDVGSDGEEGLRKYGQNQYNLVIIDIFLPKISGIRVISEIRETNQEIKIIAISGSARGPYDSKEILEVGADRFIEKTSDIEKIIDAVDEVMEEMGE